MRPIHASLIRSFTTVSLAISIGLFILLRIPSLFERFWYADEGFYAAHGAALRYGKVLYAQIWDQKPPFLYLLYYLASFLPNWDLGLVAVRLASIAFGVVAIVILFKITNRLFTEKIVRLFSLLFFTILLAIPLLEANIANAEVFFLAVTTAIFYLLLTKQKYWLIGFLTFLAFFIKFQAFFEAVLLIAIFIGADLRHYMPLAALRQTIFRLLLGFSLPFGLFFSYLFVSHTLADYAFATIFYNFSYVNNSDKITNTLGIPHLGTIIMPVALIASLALLFMCYGKKYISKIGLLILSLAVIELAATVLSGRAYAHYFLQILPGLALITGYLTWQLHRKYRLSYFITMPLCIVGYHMIAQFLIAHTLFQSYITPLPYYQSFWQTFISHTAPNPFPWRYGYMINRDQAISHKLAGVLDKNQSYYLYTEDPWVFALAGRPFTNKYVVWYHTYTISNGYQTESQNALRANLIVVDNQAQFKEKFFASLPQLTPIDEVDGFTIYQHP